MKPRWMQEDEKRASERKERVLVKMSEDQSDDMEREEAFHSLIESTGNMY